MHWKIFLFKIQLFFLDYEGYIGVRMQLNSWVATSFYPIVEKQCSVKATKIFYYETNTVYSN